LKALNKSLHQKPMLAQGETSTLYPCFPRGQAQSLRIEFYKIFYIQLNKITETLIFISSAENLLHAIETPVP
jgi:hypothetical protein